MAVRENDDVLIFDACNPHDFGVPKPIILSKNPLGGGVRFKTDAAGKQFKVTSSHGFPFKFA